MKIVIVGDGKVGSTLSRLLNAEGHDVTIVDNDAQTLHDTLEVLDAMGVHGNGASHDVQIEAGVPEADVLIATTSGDELNMICCLTAKTLGAKSTIARVRNPEYLTQLQMLKEQFGLSMVVNPELEAAREIFRVIEFPPALKVDTFSKGRVELVEFKLDASLSIVGKRLKELPALFGGFNVLIGAVEREGKVYIPGGDFQMLAGDHIHITGRSKDIAGFLYKIGEMPRTIRALMIVGGGRVGYYLAKMLDERGMQIKVIEKNRERCEDLCSALPRAVIIHADAADPDLLESEGLEDMDAFVAVTNLDEQNLIMSMLASYKGVPKVITKTTHFNYISIMGRMGIDSVVDPKFTTANEICQYVRAMQNSVEHQNIKTLHFLVDGKAEAVEFTAQKDTQGLGVPLEKLPLKKSLLVCALVRGGRVIIPHGKDSIQLGDSVIVLTTQQHALTRLGDIFIPGA